MGHIISGAGHAGLIGWVLLGNAFQPDPPPFEVTEVAVISASDFAALTAPPGPITDVALPQPPTEEAAPPNTSAVQPVDPAPAPEASAPPEPEAVPVPPMPEPDPEVAEDTPPAPEPLPDSDAPQISERPVPRQSERIAPEAVLPPEPDTAPAPVEEVAVAPEPAPEAPAQDAPQKEAAPEEATTEITTEAETPSSAPRTSLRPQARPRPPVQTANPQPETPQAPAAETPPLPETDAGAVAAALAEALGGSTAQPEAPAGPPLTAGEKDGLRVAVQRCWNVSVLSSAALETTVVVAVSMADDGKPLSNTIRLLSTSGGTSASAQQAFEAARRAIIRCGARGFDLPVEKYAQWKEIEMTFDPERMRVK